MQGYRAWSIKDFYVGGSSLTNIKFANINPSTKFIGMLKYYQKNLAQLTKTATEKERNAIKKLIRQFVVKHDHFAPVWKKIAPREKNKLLDIIASGKGIIPYEKIVSQHSLALTPEMEIFCKRARFLASLNKSLFQTTIMRIRTIFGKL